MLTLKEEMAMAVLRGHDDAAYALADKLIEERDDGVEKLAQAAVALREGEQAHDGYAVYRWPEFEAFCRRAGILWDLRTIGMSFSIKVGERFSVVHEYAASDNQNPPHAIDTTSPSITPTEG
jgi:hypothetical protein